MSEENTQINPNEPPNFNIESEDDVQPLIEQLKAFLQEHDLNVRVKFKPKKMRGSTTEVEGNGLKTGEVNIPSDFKITGKDNNGKPIDHGGDNVSIKIIDPEGEEVPCEIKDNEDGTYDVNYIPTKPGMHKIEMKVNDEEIEGSPIDVYVFDEIPDVTNTTAEGPGLEEAETKTPAPFKIITRNKNGEQLRKGGQKFNITVDGPTIPAEVTVKDNEDGTYDVEYIAKEVGVHKIDVQVEVPKKAECEEDAAEENKEMKSIKDMPKEVDVKLYHDDADPKNCWAEGKGVEGGCKTCDMAEFIIHAVKPNGEPCDLEENPFDVCVTDPDDEELETTIEKQEDGTYKATYKPTKPGEYNVEVIIRNPECPSNFEHIKDSPFTPEIIAGIKADNCVVSGPGVDGDEDLDDCNDAEFTIQAKDYNGDEIKEGGETFDIVVTDPNGEEIPCECVDNNDGTYSCKYAPEFPGNYTVDVKLKGEAVGKSPYEVMVGEGVDNDSSPVDCFQFTIKAKSKRGNPPKNAKFTVTITHENGTTVPEEDIDIKALKDMKYRVTYKVSEHGDYTIHCLLNGRDIKGSPWNQQC